jgi:hypothetical protein
MRIVETVLKASTVRIVLANNQDPALASERMDFEIPLTGLKEPRERDARSLGALEYRHLATIQVAALRYARSAITVEADRLSNLLRQSSGE